MNFLWDFMGFMNTYLRQEAYLIASEIGQCEKEECHSFKNISYLISEDIY
jgi:hypothetical protein